MHCLARQGNGERSLNPLITGSESLKGCNVDGYENLMRVRICYAMADIWQEYESRILIRLGDNAFPPFGRLRAGLSSLERQPYALSGLRSA
jgi:hypothetical protein